MHIIKLVLRWGSSGLLHLGIVLVFASAVLNYAIGDAEKSKNVLSETGIYTRFVSTLIAENSKNLEDNGTAIPLNDKNIQKIIQNEFSAELLQKRSEVVVEDLYDWLYGVSTKMELNVDFTKQRDAMYEKLAIYAADRADALQPCVYEDISRINIFEIPCQPEGYSKQIVYEAVLNDLQASNFLKNPIISNDTLPKTAKGLNIFDTYHFIPLVFQGLRDLPLITVILILISIIFILVRLPAHRAFKRLSKYYFSTGVTILLMTVIFGYILPRYTSSYEIQGSSTTKLLNKVIQAFVTSIDIVVIKVSVIFMIISGVLFIISYLSKPRINMKQLDRQTGLISSLEKKQRTLMSKKPTPPVQTSEGVNTKPKRKAKNKYKKIQL